MFQRQLFTLPLVLLCLFAAAENNAGRAADDKKDKDEKKADMPPAPLDRKVIDRNVYETLKGVINLGAEIYNGGDYIGCYRLYEGALIAFRPMLDHRPDLQKAIDKGLTDARGTGVISDKAFVLRRVIDKIRAETNPNPGAVTLWTRLGGEAGVTKVIDDFVAAAGPDPKVNFLRNNKFKDIDVAALKKKLVQFVSKAAGGPLVYTGKGMKEVHKGMAITDAEFDALAGHLQTALEKNGVKAADVKAVMDAVGGTRKDIVEGKKIEPGEAVAKSLWDRLGGGAGVTKVVDDFVAAAAADKKNVNFLRDGKYKDLDVVAFKRKLVDWISTEAGGPFKYEGKTMKAAHKGMGITGAEFDAAAGHFKAALEKNGVKAADIKTVMDRLAATRKDIVELEKLVPEPKPEAKTLWERLGGDTGVTKVVDDFVAAAAKDEKVNFFRNPNFDPPAQLVRGLKKGLIDWISSKTGGPRKYEGKDMKAAHKDMGITDAQFNALAEDLKAALKKNGVKEGDIKTVLGVVEKTRTDIVEKK